MMQTTVERVTRILLKGVRAAYLIRGERTALVDCGLPSEGNELLAALADEGVDAHGLDVLLLTHVHADHAGSAGLLARENPALEVVVHQAGAKHLRDPSRLNAAVRAAYGERFNMTGEMLAVGASNKITTPADGDVIDLGGVRITALHTEGHCKHHLAFFDEDAGWLYGGDSLGSRYEGMPSFILTPPTDYDPSLAKATIRRLEGLNAPVLALAHNRAFKPEDDFFDALCTQHDGWIEVVQGILKRTPDAGREELLEGFLAAMPELSSYPTQFFSFGLSVSGIAHYLRRKVGV